MFKFDYKGVQTKTYTKIYILLHSIHLQDSSAENTCIIANYTWSMPPQHNHLGLRLKFFTAELFFRVNLKW